MGSRMTPSVYRFLLSLTPFHEGARSPARPLSALPFYAP
jgi:hypothetical protein